MNEIEYLLEIEHLIYSIDNINEGTRDVLSLFIFHNHLSIYQIHKIIAKHGKKIAYKNSRQKVQKLIDLKLIEKEINVSKFQEKELEKGAIYYKLSEEGIFALFYNSNVFFKPPVYYVQRAFENGKTVEDMSDIFAEYKKEIFMNFSNCSFFELFLFPWISKETIERVNEKILDNVIMFLNECCIIVKNYILETSNLNIFRDMENVWYLNSEIMHGDRIPGLESVIVDDKDLLSYMQNSLNEGMSIVRIKRGDNKNNILLSEPPSDGFSYKDRLLLAYKDKENESNFISFFKNAEGSSLFNYSIGHKLISNPMFYPIGEDLDLKSLYLKAVFSIVMGVSKDDDLKLLKEDVKFMETLSELKERFNEGYELLAK